jgi:hypothetical protein
MLIKYKRYNTVKGLLGKESLLKMSFLQQWLGKLKKLLPPERILIRCKTGVDITIHPVAASFKLGIIKFPIYKPVGGKINQLDTQYQVIVLMILPIAIVITAVFVSHVPVAC